MIRQKNLEVVQSKPQDPISIRLEARRYALAAPIIDMLRRHQKILSFQEYKTIRGQALAGDISGAKKGLMKLIGERTKQ